MKRDFLNSGSVPQNDNIISAKAVRIDTIKSYHERSEAACFDDDDGAIIDSSEVDAIWTESICEQCGQYHGNRPTFEGVKTSMDIIPELMTRVY